MDYGVQVRLGTFVLLGWILSCSAADLVFSQYAWKAGVAELNPAIAAILRDLGSIGATWFKWGMHALLLIAVTVAPPRRWITISMLGTALIYTSVVVYHLQALSSLEIGPF